MQLLQKSRADLHNTDAIGRWTGHSTSRELIADNGSTFGSQYNTSQGTSFAAPVISGVVALMLEANPNLGYRDVQTILAMSATSFTDSGTTWASNSAKNWNGGGMHFSHDYGFGKVDARAAVRLAETWYDQSTAYNEQTRTNSSGTINAAIPDGAGVLTRTLAMTVNNTCMGLRIKRNTIKSIACRAGFIRARGLKRLRKRCQRLFGKFTAQFSGITVRSYQQGAQRPRVDAKSVRTFRK